MAAFRELGFIEKQRAGSCRKQINVLPTALVKKRMLQIRQDGQAQDAEFQSLLGEDAAHKLIELLRGVVQ